MKFKPEEVPEDLEELIPDFIENTFADYRELIKNIEQNDVEGMRAVCHRILGTAASYGFMQMDEIFTSLQEVLRNEGIDSASKEIEHVHEYFDFLKDQYQVKVD